jgi:putative transcriptional regulator
MLFLVYLLKLQLKVGIVTGLTVEAKDIAPKSLTISFGFYKEQIMAIIINIDVMLAKRKMSVTELTEKVGITMANLSILKNGKAKAIRFSTLEAVCKALDCQPGDILEYQEGKDERGESDS